MKEFYLALALFSLSAAAVAQSSVPGYVFASQNTTGTPPPPLQNGGSNAFASLPNGGTVIADPSYFYGPSTTISNAGDRPGYFTGLSYNIGYALPALSRWLDNRAGRDTELANNWPVDNMTGQYDANNRMCLQSALPADNGNPGQLPATIGANCFQLFQNSTVNGWNYGATNNFVSNIFAINAFNSTQGITNPFGITGNFTGGGDLNILNLYVNAKCAWIRPSQEGCRLHEERLTEDGDYTGTVTNPNSAQTPGTAFVALHATSNAQNLSPWTPLLDMSAYYAFGTLVSFTGSGNTAALGTFNALQPIPFPVSMQCTLETSFTTPRTPTNTSTLATFTLNCPSAPAVGQQAGFYTSGLSPEFPKLVSVSSAGSGNYTCTAYFNFNYASGLTVNVGGMVGRYMEFTTYTGSGERVVQRIFSSPSTTTLTYGFETANSGINSFSYPGPVRFYHGADIKSPINPATGLNDGGGAYITDTDVFASVQDSVENTNHISADFALESHVITVNNPFAGVTPMISYELHGAGAGGGLTSGVATGVGNSQFEDFYNTNADSLYADSGGSYHPLNAIYLQGKWACGLCMSEAPTGATPVIGFGYPQTTGSKVVTLLKDTNSGNGLTYDFVAKQFSFNTSSGGTSSAGLNIVGGSLQLSGVPISQSSTAPSGSCTTIGWNLSNDGHISFCNGTTWAVKI